MTVNNTLFFERWCGVKGGNNETCDNLLDAYEKDSRIMGEPICDTCETDFCNGTNALSLRDVNIITALVSTLAIVIMMF